MDPPNPHYRGPRQPHPLPPLSIDSNMNNQPRPSHAPPPSQPASSSARAAFSRTPIPPQVSFQEPTRPPFDQQSASTVKLTGRTDTWDPSSSSTALGTAQLPTLDDTSGFSGAAPGQGIGGAQFRRKKSLVRPDRERIDPTHRQWYYRNHAAQMENQHHGGFLPSTTGHLPQHGANPPEAGFAGIAGPGGGVSGMGVMGPEGVMTAPAGVAAIPGGGGLRRGRSILARDEDIAETGLNFLKRGVSLRRKRTSASASIVGPDDEGKGAAFSGKNERMAYGGGPLDAWMIYCYVLTFCCPAPILKCFGIRTPEQQRAWREKMGLLALIGVLMTGVGFLTFGFTKSVCGRPPVRYRTGSVNSGSMIFHGYNYDMTHYIHPAAPGINASNPLYSEPWSTGGLDGSFMFQNTQGNCKGIITAAKGSQIPKTPTGDLSWFFPCNLFSQSGNTQPNLTGYTDNVLCHVSKQQKSSFANFGRATNVSQIYFQWSDVNSTRNLAVWQSSVLDLSLLNWLDPTQVRYPAWFDELKSGNASWQSRDITAAVMRKGLSKYAACLDDVVKVGFIDTNTIGCVASDIVLYVSLVFIVGVVAIRFAMAVIFGWFIGWRIGNYKNETYEERMKRMAEIEQWSGDIYRPAPGSYRPNVLHKSRKSTFFPTTSRFSTFGGHGLGKVGGAAGGGLRPVSAYAPGLATPDRRSQAALSVYGNPKAMLAAGLEGRTPPGSPMLRGSRSSTSLAYPGKDISDGSRRSSISDGTGKACPFPLARGVVPQPAPDWQPFNFPLAHTMCLVTAYSESLEGLRTTLDSLATTDYPNSHKLILVICDGIVKGAGNDMSTPDICLSMMKGLITPAEEVEGHSYVAIADGHKRHNMAKVYAGFYDYDDDTVEPSKQQRVPMVLVAKCGNPLEAHDAKPGNRGKRDSQVLIMAFLQKVMFDERMTTFEYEFFNSIWRVTGVSPDVYEVMLMVDADTKIFPDSLSRMTSAMVQDPEIMGLCGETKIANKAETWVTMIQVFEYYTSHHMTKAFEACFGGVTCLPGCFSAYRIKAPKGALGYWVPILANPDIVEHYSENVVDTLHKKNLLLLGEDRYLTTLMLKTFPKRKMVFVPGAVCKTVVPDTFRVLLSQRRRWINSTVHNLAELLFVRDLCGTFCFSMQFVVGMELAGTLVLPAAISFTLYLIILAIIPTAVTPVIPLILLAIILGLPGLLIVITSRRIAYVGWMFIYLLSLPIWNFVLPTYAFWHFDDFSWGQTRKIEGDDGAAHDGKEGEFDSSHIVMKRWAEFERERRWKSGTVSRDSTYDVVHRSESPRRAESTRFSMVSSSETYHSNPSDQFGTRGGLAAAAAPPAGYDDDHSGGGRHASRSRIDSVPLLELPAPLAPNASQARNTPTSPPGGSRDLSPNSRTGMTANSSAASLSRDHSATPPVAASARYEYPSDARASFAHERQPIMHDGDEGTSDGLGAASSSVHLRHGHVSSENSYPQLSPPDQHASYAEAFSAEPEILVGSPALVSASSSSSHHLVSSSQARPARDGPQLARGVSLTDDGPMPGARTVVRNKRQSRRSSRGGVSIQSPVSPSSSEAGHSGMFNTGGGGAPSTLGHGSTSSGASRLPPGAAAPKPPGAPSPF